MKAANIKKCFSLYEEAVRKNTVTVVSMDLIRSHLHQLFFETVHKKCLTGFGENRYLLEDGVSSYAYGHYKIKTI